MCSCAVLRDDDDCEHFLNLVFCQPIYAAVEEWATKKNPKILRRITIFRLIWRTSFVILCTLMAILLPFFNDVLAFLGAVGFWPLTVYFPTEMYIAQNKIPRFSRRWNLLKSLSFLCFIVSLVAAIGSVEGMIKALGHFTPFKTKS